MALFILSNQSIQSRTIHLLLAIENNGWSEPCSNAMLFVHFTVFCPNNTAICIAIAISIEIKQTLIWIWCFDNVIQNNEYEKMF